MSKLEDLIKKHRDMANIREPRAGHFMRFFKKTGFTRFSEERYAISRYVLVAAASVIIAVVMSTFFPENKNTGFVTDVPAELNYPAELSYVIYYYESISSKLIDKILNQKMVDRNEKKRINNDIKAYEAWHLDILEDYRKFPDDDRILNTIIEFHKSKAEMLNEIYIVITGDNTPERSLNMSISS